MYAHLHVVEYSDYKKEVRFHFRKEDLLKEAFIPTIIAHSTREIQVDDAYLEDLGMQFAHVCLDNPEHFNSLLNKLPEKNFHAFLRKINPLLGMTVQSKKEIKRLFGETTTWETEKNHLSRQLYEQFFDHIKGLLTAFIYVDALDSTEFKSKLSACFDESGALKDEERTLLLRLNLSFDRKKMTEEWINDPLVAYYVATQETKETGLYVDYIADCTQKRDIFFEKNKGELL